MTSAFLTPQHLRPFSRGAERQHSVNTKSNIRINPAPSRRVASFHKYAGRKLFPGQPGTKKLMDRYGDNLLCVRYRYDPEGKRRLKTVELIVAETPWQPAVDPISPDQMMRLWLPYDELDLQRQVEAAGGKWNPQQKIRELPYREVLELGLVDYLIEEGIANAECF